MVVGSIRRAASLWGVRKAFVLVDQLAQLKPPLLLVWGAEDRIIPVAHAYEAVKAAPQAQLHVFDRCGHWPEMERASAFNALVSEFLSS